MTDAPSLAAALALPFVQNALAIAVLASVLCGVLGVFVVTKRVAFLGDGISHAAFGGLGVCAFLGVDPRLGAVVVAVLCALLLGALGNDRMRSHDALIGLLYAAGMAIGILFVHKTPGYVPNLMNYLFGNLLLASRADAWLTLGLAAVVLLVVWVLRKGLLAAAFDETFAFVQGVPVRALFTLLLVLIALTVVLLIQVVGVILVVALLTIPPLAGRAVARTFGGMVGAAVVCSLAGTLGGLWLSYRFDLPTGPAIILAGIGVLATVTAAAKLARRRS